MRPFSKWKSVISLSFCTLPLLDKTLILPFIFRNHFSFSSIHTQWTFPLINFYISIVFLSFSLALDAHPFTPSRLFDDDAKKSKYRSLPSTHKIGLLSTPSTSFGNLDDDLDAISMYSRNKSLTNPFWYTENYMRYY